jgi:hypothetical protein
VETSSDSLRGVVHGKMIELEQAPGLPDGQAVTVIVQPIRPAGEGLRASFGAWDDDPKGLDAFLAEVRRDREERRVEPTP